MTRRKQRLEDVHVVELIEELVYRRERDWKTTPDVVAILRRAMQEPSVEADMHHRAAVLITGFGERLHDSAVRP